MKIQTFAGIGFIEEHGTHYPSLTGAKNEVLGTILHSTTHPAPIEPLMERLWPESSSQQAKSSLNTVIWRLNSLLKKVLPNSGVAINNDRDRVKINWRDQNPEFDFENLKRVVHGYEQKALSKSSLNNAELIELVRAIEFYRGDFIPNLDSHWATIARERYRSIFIRGCQLAVQSFAEQSRFDRAISFAAKILVENPFRENTRQQLIWLYVMNGQRIEAYRLYQETCQMLREELGVDPMPETQALLNLIKDGKTAPVLNFKNIHSERHKLLEALFCPSN